MNTRAIPAGKRVHYHKWLRYYLDFCDKYRFQSMSRESLPPFLLKLEEKGQTRFQREQATEALKIYYEFAEITSEQRENEVQRDEARSPQRAVENRGAGDAPGVPLAPSPPTDDHRSPQVAPQPRAPMADVAPASITAGASRLVGKGASWTAVFKGLAEEIQVRHYSRKTLRAYTQWVRHFQTFTRSQDPQTLNTEHVKAFLTFLAVEKKVSASTQNQAFNALLFFYKHVLKREFGKVEGVVRAKRKPYIPVVLSRDEIDAILAHLKSPYDLVVKILYGCGLRLFECLQLRVQCLNFDACNVTVHDGKGGKDRTVPLPETILPELRAHLERLKDLHQYGRIETLRA